MKSTIITKGIDASQALRDYISDRVDSALSRAKDSIHFITVRISGTQNSKGSLISRCQINLTLPGMPAIVVSEVSANINGAIDRAAQRAAKVVGRVLQRAQQMHPINVPVLRRIGY